MKTVFLLRHGEAQDDDYDSDYHRKLTERGKLRTSILADHLKTKKNNFDLIISSGAPRAKASAEIFASHYEYDDDRLIINDLIYNDPTDSDLIQLLWNTDENIKSLLIVGHNPSISSFAEHLTGLTRINMKKTSIIKLQFDNDSWESITPGSGKALFYTTFSKGEVVEITDFNL